MEAVLDFPARAVPVLPAFGVCRRSWHYTHLTEPSLGPNLGPKAQPSGECRLKLAPGFGVRPWRRTDSGCCFDHLPGVVVLELGGAQIAEG